MEQTNNQSFEELLAQSFSNEKEIKVGEIVPGKVIRIGKDAVTVDIGYKSEGQISKSEFKDADGSLIVDEGSEIDVFVESMENEDGLVILSKEKADKLRIWDEIAEACQNGEVIEGKVTDRVKGGLAVDIGVKAFLPGSQIDLVPVRNLDGFVGNTYQFKIVKFNKIRGNIVLSRRAILEKERYALKEKTLEVLEEGCTLEGTVKNITDYGAFIDLGGIDGLLHITDVSWKRINHPSEVLKVGEAINVKVLKFDKEKQRVSLGMKQITDDPWADADLRYAKNSTVKGKVVNLTDYGAFLEIEEGVEGLIHVSEMSWTKRVKHPSAILNLGDEVEAVVLEIEKENRRMSLGLKQTQPNPWDELVQKYPEGTKVKGVVRNVTDFGLFIEVEDGIDGLVHVSDLSWANKSKNPHDQYKKGDEIEAVVLNVDPAAEKFSLGIKQLSDDPWKDISKTYKPGSEVEGEVVKTADFGVFVKIGEDVEALIHNSEIDGGEEALPKVGEKIKATILSVDSGEQKISLSTKKMSKEEKEKILKRNQSQAAPTLGDIMAEKLKG
ncbi:MAG: 30S ribosomal protein S1 [Bdellovibrionales bacterium]|nr:30S ribosomal protein S1 [Bdellovibrionales bacterium]